MNPKVTYIVARVLIASTFVGFGLERLIAATMLGQGRPSALWMLFYVFQMLAGIILMVGWQTGRIAIVMSVLMAIDAFTAHPFWNFGGAEQQQQLQHFLKNFAVIGGLLLVSWIEEQGSEESSL
jgi:putative oxidoreductase